MLFLKIKYHTGGGQKSAKNCRVLFECSLIVLKEYYDNGFGTQ